jgi:CheY-like chemotaxis protein
MSANRRILVVDDEAIVLLIVHDTLETMGNHYEIVTAQSGAQALELARKKPFDLVITDLSMPEMDGVELTEAIKSLHPATTILWITAYGCHNYQDEARRLAVYGCWDKPLEISEILHMTEEALAAGNKRPDPPGYGARLKPPAPPPAAQNGMLEPGPGTPCPRATAPDRTQPPREVQSVR